MALEDIKNPYNGVRAPDPQDWLFGTKSSGYQSDLNKYNQAQQAALWDAQIALMADDRAYAEEIYNKYNSPEAQVKQMRAAGLNPDLQGVSSSGMSSSQSTHPSGSVPSMLSDAPNLGLDFIRALPQAIGIVTGSIQSIQKITQKNADLSKSADDIGLSILGTALPKEVFSKDDKNGLHSFLKSYDPSIDIANYLGNGNSRFAKRVRNSIDRYLGGNMEDLREKIYSKYHSAESERQGFLNLLGNHGYSVDDGIFVKVIKEFNDVLKQSSKNKSSYESDYYGNKNGKTQAETENKVSEKTGKKADNDIMTQLMSRANKMLDSDDWKENTVGAILYFGTLFLQSRLGVPE